jgi:hypothetical protein
MGGGVTEYESQEAGEKNATDQDKSQFLYHDFSISVKIPLLNEQVPHHDGDKVACCSCFSVRIGVKTQCNYLGTVLGAIVLIFTENAKLFLPASISVWIAFLHRESIVSP